MTPELELDIFKQKSRTVTIDLSSVSHTVSPVAKGEPANRYWKCRVFYALAINFIKRCKLALHQTPPLVPILLVFFATFFTGLITAADNLQKTPTTHESQGNAISHACSLYVPLPSFFSYFLRTRRPRSLLNSAGLASKMFVLQGEWGLRGRCVQVFATSRFISFYEYRSLLFLSQFNSFSFKFVFLTDCHTALFTLILGI